MTQPLIGLVFSILFLLAASHFEGRYERSGGARYLFASLMSAVGLLAVMVCCAWLGVRAIEWAGAVVMGRLRS